MKIQLLRRRTLPCPTLYGWGCLLLLAVALLAGCGSGLHPFLAVTKPVPANILVVEGWVPDYLVEAAVAEFARGGYDYLCTSGGPLPKGYVVTGYRSYAELAAASLRKLRFDDAKLLEAPGASTYRNRTYQSAVAVKERLSNLGLGIKGLNVLTMGPHARRTLTVFHKVFGDTIEVGIISEPSQDYDPQRWWSSSEGTKEVVTEALGFAYEWLFDGGR